MTRIPTGSTPPGSPPVSPRKAEPSSPEPLRRRITRTPRSPRNFVVDADIVRQHIAAEGRRAEERIIATFAQNAGGSGIMVEVVDPNKVESVQIVQSPRGGVSERREIFEKTIPTSEEPAPATTRVDRRETVSRSEFERRRQLFDQGSAPSLASRTVTTTTNTSRTKVSGPPARPLPQLPLGRLQPSGREEPAIQSPRRDAASALPPYTPRESKK
jgi:hypothetical protein